MLLFFPTNISWAYKWVPLRSNVPLPSTLSPSPTLDAFFARRSFIANYPISILTSDIPASCWCSADQGSELARTLLTTDHLNRTQGLDESVAMEKAWTSFNGHVMNTPGLGEMYDCRSKS